MVDIRTLCFKGETFGLYSGIRMKPIQNNQILLATTIQ